MNRPSADAWLFVLDEGSVTLKQIADHLGMTRNQLNGTITRMQKAGMFSVIGKDLNDPQSRVRLSVTGDCVIPQGIKLKEILK